MKLQEMARGLKFLIKKVEGLFYLCRENKGADQLCGCHTADLHLCFRIIKSWFSHDLAQKISHLHVDPLDGLICLKFNNGMFIRDKKFCSLCHNFVKWFKHAPP